MSGLPGSYFAPGNSFLEFLRVQEPASPALQLTAVSGSDGSAPASLTATTVVALTYREGVVMAGDRRATQGHQIASRDIEKVYPADATTAIGLAGVAGLALQLVRLYQLELEHYEKIEGAPLSLRGKANRLATMMRSQLDLALKGLPVVPLLAGWDQTPHIYSFDVTGGSYEERHFAAIGSGAIHAKGSLKKLYKPTARATAAIRTALTALMDAAEEDTGTGGVDRAREIYPVVARVDQHGYTRVPDSELARILGGAA
ncbi:MAG: proteasome subunit beta [Bifidobacteriaceae bacterium]|jgi:proteasome beta subunit|nr:proteasome subunit beta [Bifidobacteriaceae bacterium]